MERIPFHEVAWDSRLLRVLIEGRLPTAPERLLSLPDGLQQHIQRCWSRDPTQRPTIQEGIEILDGLLVDMRELHSWKKSARLPPPEGISPPGKLCGRDRMGHANQCEFDSSSEMSVAPTLVDALREPFVPPSPSVSANLGGNGDGKKRSLFARVAGSFKSPLR